MSGRTFSSGTERRTGRAPMGLLAVGMALVGMLGLSGSAAAAVVGPQGSATMDLGSGKAAKALTDAGIRISATGAAIPTQLSKGRVRIEAPANDVSVTGDRGVITLAGSLVFFRGSERLVIGRLSVVSGNDASAVKGRIGKKTVSLFKTGGPAELDDQVGTVALAGRATGLSPAAAREIASRFGIDRLPASRVGTSSASGQAAFEDPYGTLCGLQATSKTAGTLQEAGSPPEFEGATAATGLDISWGFRSGFRNYLFYLPEAQGVMQAFDGSSVIPNPVPGLAPTGFKWPYLTGRFNQASTGVATDQVVLEGSGTIVLCHKGQFRVNLSKPTIVIDGLKAQLVFDVDTSVNVNPAESKVDWIPNQRVVLANLVTSEATRTQTASSITWANVPVILTEAGSEVLRLAPFSPTFRYQAGQALQTIGFTVTSAPPA
ncbi:MAG: HtaA domain-containing protein [Solirubrobacterales bacterium]